MGVVSLANPGRVDEKACCPRVVWRVDVGRGRGVRLVVG